mgnify:CR=1 FL=1
MMKNLENYKIYKKKVLFRADLNVPVVEGIITDTSRILASKSSIKKLISKKNKIFILAHFGRPKGDIIEKLSLRFICNSLKKIFEIEKIHFLEKLDEKFINQKIDEMQNGEVCLIENIRFQKAEEKIDINFTKNISKLFDVYVNDAFSASHRKHMSITGFAKYIPAVAGNHLIKEIKNIDLFLKNSKKPNIAIVGGAKISTKIQLLYNLIEKFSTIAIGGAMANTFLLANNINIGQSLVEKELINEAKNIQSKSKELNCNIILPVDVMCGNNLKDTQPKQFKINKIPSDLMIFDIGYTTTEIICKQILNSKMLLWNGPVGAFEYKPYDRATTEIANTIKLNAKKLNIEALAGGGDTISSIKAVNAEDGFTYISNAGGAFLEWLEENESPGVIALHENNFN